MDFDGDTGQDGDSNGDDSAQGDGGFDGGEDYSSADDGDYGDAGDDSSTGDGTDYDWSMDGGGADSLDSGYDAGGVDGADVSGDAAGYAANTLSLGERAHSLAIAGGAALYDWYDRVAAVYDMATGDDAGADRHMEDADAESDALWRNLRQGFEGQPIEPSLSEKRRIQRQIDDLQ